MATLRILHLEDRKEDAFLVEQTLAESGIEAKIRLARDRSEFLAALDGEHFDLILADNSTPSFSARDALEITRQKCPDAPVICLSGAATDELASACLDAGAVAYLLKDHPWQLVAAVRCEAERMRLRQSNRELTRLAGELDQRLKDRTAQLEITHRELESFSYAVSHDFGAPLRAVRMFAELVLKECKDKLDNEARGWLEKIHAGSQQMKTLINELMRLSKVSTGPFQCAPVDLTALSREVISRLADQTPDRKVSVKIADGMKAQGDPGLLKVAMENLLSNAWKYTSKSPDPRIEIGCHVKDGASTYYVRDNGAGFDLERAKKLFQPFQRFHREDEFAGAGVGLATVQRVIQRHGGRIWADAAVGKGATFHFTLSP